MTTSQQESDFMKDVLPGSFLDDSIAWIARNLLPEDVFPDIDLATWAEDNGFVYKGVKETP